MCRRASRPNVVPAQGASRHRCRRESAPLLTGVAHVRRRDSAPSVGAGPADTALPDGCAASSSTGASSRLDGGAGAARRRPPARRLRLAPAGCALLAGGGFTVTDAASADTGQAAARRGGVVHPVPDGERARDRGDVTVVAAGQGPDRRRRSRDRRASPGPGRCGRRRRRVGQSRRPRGGRAPDQGPGRRAETRCKPRPCPTAAQAAARNAPGWPPRRARSSPSSIPTWCRAPGWLDPLLAHLGDPAIRAGGAPDDRPAAAGWLGGAAAGPRLARQVRGGAVVAGPGPGPGHRRAAHPGRLRPQRGAARPPGSRWRGLDERHARRRGRRPGLRVRGAGWRMRYEPSSRVAHKDHRTGLRRVVAAEGVLRDRGGPARAAPPRRGTAAGAQPVGGGGPPAAPGPPSGRRRRCGRVGRAPAGPAAAGAVTPVPRGRPDHRARRDAGAVEPNRGRTSTATTGRCPSLACAVTPTAPQVITIHGALIEGVVDWLRHRDRDPCVGPRPVRPRRRAPARRSGLWRRAVVGCPAPPASPRTVGPLGPRFATVAEPGARLLSDLNPPRVCVDRVN